MSDAKELSHVVAEHRLWPEADAEATTSCADDVCVTCSDEGRVAEVTAVHDHGLAEVLIGGRAETIDTSLVDAEPGDLVLVHAGVAITMLGPVPAPAASGDSATARGGPGSTFYPFIETEANGAP